MPSSSSPGLLYILITTPESFEAIYFLFTVAEKHFSRAWSEDNVVVIESQVSDEREQVKRCKYPDLMPFNCAKTAQLDSILVQVNI